MVERLLPKQDIVGSSPITRSDITVAFEDGWVMVPKLIFVCRQETNSLLYSVKPRMKLYLIGLLLDEVLSIPTDISSRLACALVT